MNILRLVRMFYSKNFIKEIIVIIQIVVLICAFNLSVIPFDNLQTSRQIIENQLLFDAETSLCFLPTLNLTEQNLTDSSGTENLFNTIENDKNIISFYKMSSCDAVIGENENSRNVAINIYTENLFRCLNLQIDNESKQLSTQPYSNNILPIYISSNLGQYYDVGDVIPIKWFSGNRVNFNCQVIGVLKHDASVVTTGTQNQVLSYRIANNENFIITEYNKSFFNNIRWNASFFVELDAESDVDKTLSTLNNEYIDYGEFKTINQVFEDEFKRTLKESEWNILMFFLISLVLIFGYGGYIIVKAIRKKHLYSVLYICGISFRKMLVINIIAEALMFLPALLIGIAISPTLVEGFAFTEFTGYNAKTLAFIIIVFFCGILSATILSIYQTKKISIINLYNSNE